jgi:hypothetical protein
MVLMSYGANQVTWNWKRRSTGTSLRDDFWLNLPQNQYSTYAGANLRSKSNKKPWIYSSVHSSP